MFRGEFVKKIMKNKRVSFKFDLRGQQCDVLCLKDSRGNVRVIICPTKGADVEQYYDFYEVLERKQISVKKEIKLPQDFLDFINGESEVVVSGAGDRIAIEKKGCSDFDMLNDEEKKEFLCMIDNLLGEVDG